MITSRCERSSWWAALGLVLVDIEALLGNREKLLWSLSAPRSCHKNIAKFVYSVLRFDDLITLQIWPRWPLYVCFLRL